MEVTEVKSSIWGVSLAKQGDLVEGIDFINQCLKILLNTRLGSIPLNEEFGCKVFDRFDKPMTQLRALVPGDVKECVDLFIPEITVVKVTSVMEVGSLTVFVQWAFLNTVETNQISVTYGIK